MLKEKETRNNFEATRMVSSLLIRPDRGSSRVKLTKKKDERKKPKRKKLKRRPICVCQRRMVGNKIIEAHGGEGGGVVERGYDIRPPRQIFKKLVNKNPR